MEPNGELYMLKSADTVETKLRSNFSQLLNSGLLTDCSLVSGDGTSVRVHRAILCGSSPYLEHLMVIRNADVNPNFVFPDIEHKFLEKIIQFIYAGELKVKKEDLGGVMMTAVKLRITIDKIVTIDESADVPSDSESPLSTTQEDDSSDAKSSQEEVKEEVVFKTSEQQNESVLPSSVSTRPKRNLPSLNYFGSSGPSSKEKVSKQQEKHHLPAPVLTSPKRQTNDLKEKVSFGKASGQPRSIDYQAQNDANFLNMFTSPAEYICRHCHKANRNKKCKQSHERTCSLNPNKPVFPCPQCPITYTRHYRMTAHIKTHKLK